MAARGGETLGKRRLRRIEGQWAAKYLAREDDLALPPAQATSAQSSGCRIAALVCQLNPARRGCRPPTRSGNEKFHVAKRVPPLTTFHVLYYACADT